ncbi:MAG TPA: SsrA-binding protein, partial [Lactobacillus sp.]|nr:SsrA-binding protein [Lactobacillus sp.]
MAKKKTPTDKNVMAQNKKARHDYTILNTYEAGLVLTGTEIKSIRAKRVNLTDGFAQVRNGEAWLMNI